MRTIGAWRVGREAKSLGGIELELKLKLDGINGARDPEDPRAD